MGTSGIRQIAARRDSQRGFTLVEMMIVVVIVGVLAGLAVYSVRRYMFASKTAEAGEMINSIRAAQEVYKGDAFEYLDVSGSNAVTDMNQFYPSTAPGNFKTVWGDSSTSIGKRWKALNVAASGGVYFAYACSAGGANNTVDTYDIDGIWVGTPRPGIQGWPPASWAPSPWYVIKVVGNLSGGDKKQLWVTASFTDQLFNNVDTE
jgi:type IV pilus assembly protein PilA